MRLFLILIMSMLPLLASIGKVTIIKGNADILRDSGQLKVKKGLAVEEKDLLKTTIKSKVQIILNDDTVVTVGPQSEYLFEHFQQEGEPEVMMELKRGFFKTVTGKIGKIAPQRFKIKTRAATIGIRGTQFMAYIAENGDELIGCIQGRIVIYTHKSRFNVPAGKMLEYHNGTWTMQDIKLDKFRPVFIGLAPQRAEGAEGEIYLPGFQDITILQELTQQSLQDSPTAQPTTPKVPTLNIVPPFATEFTADDTPLPPPYNP